MSEDDRKLISNISSAKCMSIGANTGIFLGASENLFIGDKSGFETRSSNNILIGHDTICGKGDHILIGNDRQTHVNIGAYDLEYLAIELSELKQKVAQMSTD